MDRWTELALVSHEVGGALTPARSAVHLLREDPPAGMDSRQEHLLEMIARSLARTDRVLGNLRSIALPESYQENLETCRPHAWLNEWIRPYQDEASSRNLRLDLDITDGMPAFPADPFLLEQVLGNLVSNALKFTASGGHVRVSVAPCRGAVLPGKMLLLAGGFGVRPRFLQFQVEDSGIGISAETRRHLFQPFYRGPEAVPHAGTGLGLTVSRRFAHLLHGDLRAEDCSSGARFVLTLPADAATRALSASIDELYAALRRQILEQSCSLLVARLNDETRAETADTCIEKLVQQTGSRCWRLSRTTWVVLGASPVRHLYRMLAAQVARSEHALEKELHVHVRRVQRGEPVDELALQSVVRCRQAFPQSVLSSLQHGNHMHSGTEVA